jgi:RHS repeat-associated protein
MHEHLDAFGIINMNGRVYDPLTAMFFSPDPFVQAPGNWLNYNRYGYCLNNPFKYVDPNGEVFWLIAAGIFLLFTEPGYEIQKFFLPAAFKVNIQLGSDRISIGFDTSVGTPQMFEGYRNEYGKSYVFKDINGYKGGETRRGKEWSSGYKGYFMKF